MATRIGREVSNAWTETDGSAPWGHVFKVNWRARCDLPFQDTLHLTNPLNLNKPVKISRDGQELPEDIGRALCSLIDHGLKKRLHLVHMTNADIVTYQKDE